MGFKFSNAYQTIDYEIESPNIGNQYGKKKTTFGPSKKLICNKT
jgi:hypothetical protein